MTGNYDQTCPNCARKLEKLSTRHGVMWSCPSCKGNAIGAGLLQKISEPALIQKVWVKAQQEKNETGKACPSCKQMMWIVKAGPQLGSVELDICHRCYYIWFDNEELEKVPRASEAEIEARDEEKTTEKRSKRPEPLRSYHDADLFDDEEFFDLLSFLARWIRHL